MELLLLYPILTILNEKFVTIKHMDGFVLRKYQPRDKSEVKKLYELASIHSEIGYRSGPWEKDFDDIENVYFNGGDFLVGLVDNQIVAIGALRKETDAIAYIRRMRVHPDHRRKGYARMIVERLEKTAKANNCKELRLKTSTLQKMAQNFYEKNGFTRMDADKEFYMEGDGKTFESVWYRKFLKK